MDKAISKAMNHWRLKRRLSHFNQWFMGPVFFVTLFSLILGVHTTELSTHYQDYDFWVATKMTIYVIAQSLGW